MILKLVKHITEGQRKGGGWEREGKVDRERFQSPR